MWADVRRSIRVHPAWKWGLSAIVGSFPLAQAITYSSAGTAIYAWVNRGGREVPPCRRSSSSRRPRGR